jgi:hypothetical protein
VVDVARGLAAEPVAADRLAQGVAVLVGRSDQPARAVGVGHDDDDGQVGALAEVDDAVDEVVAVEGGVGGLDDDDITLTQAGEAEVGGLGIDIDGARHGRPDPALQALGDAVPDPLADRVVQHAARAAAVVTERVAPRVTERVAEAAVHDPRAARAAGAGGRERERGVTLALGELAAAVAPVAQAPGCEDPDPERAGDGHGGQQRGERQHASGPS